MTRRLNAMELVGAAMVLSLVLTATFAPRLAPYDPTRAVATTLRRSRAALGRISARHR